MARVFVSYAHQDREIVQQIAEGLRALQHQVFFAGDAVTAGKPWREIIAGSLQEADAVIIIISKESVRSNWIMAEVGAAIAYSRERGKSSVIPVVIDDINPPAVLSEIQCIIVPERDVTRITNLLARALDDLVGRQIAEEQEKEEVRSRVKATAAEYISVSLNQLRSRERTYRRTALVWYSLGYFALLGGIGFGIWRATIATSTSINWPTLAHFAAISAITIGLLIALSKFAFTLGKSFMVESLRNSDRIHAISFGEFYLKAFGEKAEWKEVKEALQHWNIDLGSSFISQDTSQYDPKMVETGIEIAKFLSAQVDKLKK